MNIFQIYQKKIFDHLIKEKNNKLIDFPDTLEHINTELPPKDQKADISCNAAMILAKFNKKSPLELGLKLKESLLRNFSEFENIEVAKQGFLNISFKREFWKDFLDNVIFLKSSFGSNKINTKKYNLEFVSANPTGPLHVGHCRGAILGDTISNLLKFNGHEVINEYYVNDYGAQIQNFVKSVHFRILEITTNKKFPNEEDLYPGNYIIDIAKKIIDEKKIKDFDDFNLINKKLTLDALKHSMTLIKNNLKILGIKHDIFVHESQLIKNNFVEKTVDELKNNKLVYEGYLEPPKGELNKSWKPRKQLLFNSKRFGDDSDRALKKEDGTWTYFASDIAYHAHKVQRKFDVLINILGADHAGYIKRITSATSAVSKEKTNLICKVSQLVKLYKNGKPFKMSKRKGDYVTVDDLISEVGKDSVRFMMLSRSNDTELDFDFEKVTEKSKDNPVFYVQYAFARINSIFNSIKLNLDSEIKVKNKDFSINDYEVQLLKKISEWPKCVDLSVSRLEPHRIPFYLYELVTLFHSYWNLGKEKKEFRFVSENLNLSRLIILQALSIVIKNGMSILGVNTPNSM